MSINELKTIFYETLTMEGLEFTSRLSKTDVSDWDSFNHLNIMIAVEEKSGVQIRPDEVELIDSVGTLVEILNQKGCQIEW